MENKNYENNNIDRSEGTGLEAIFSSSQKETEHYSAQQRIDQNDYNNQTANTQNYNSQPQSFAAQTVQPVQPVQQAQPVQPVHQVQQAQPVQQTQGFVQNPQQTSDYSQNASQQNPQSMPGFSQTYSRPQSYSPYTDPYRSDAQNGYYNRIYGNNFAESDLDKKPEITAPKKKKAKKGTAKKTAFFAAMIALSLCVGLGGGIAGSYLMSSGSDSAVKTSSGSDSSKKSDDSSDGSSKTISKDGSLVITQASNTDTPPTTTTEVVAKVKDSVVEITTESTSYDSFYGQYVSQGAGSGVIISEDGYILTNHHVIEDASSIKVRLTNGTSYDAKLIGSDSLVDIALLKIEEKGLTTATFGDSAKLSVGQTSIVIGNPLGRLGGTVTDGIISALDREIKIDGKTMNLLQTNAAINPGNSGGGMFDANGNLIGIVVAKSSSSSSGASVEGLGYAIPINDIISILDDLKTDGYVSDRAYLGINLQDINSENDMLLYRVDRAGTYVSSVGSGSAAEKGGLKIGDCIIKIDDKDITQASEVSAVIAKHKKDDQVKITVVRDGKEIVLDVTLDASPDSNTSSSKNRSDRNFGPSSEFYGYDSDGFGNES